MKIDLHTHILPRDWPDLDAKYGYSGFVRLDHYEPCCARMMIGDRVFREITDNVWDPKRRIEDCDRHGISMQVLSTVPVMFSYWAKSADALDLSRQLNDRIAEVVRDHPKRFAGLATIPMQDPDLAAGELERCVRELGLRGAQIGTHVDVNPHSGRIDALNLDNASLQPVWSAAEQLGAAISLGSAYAGSTDRLQEKALREREGLPAGWRRARISWHLNRCNLVTLLANHDATESSVDFPDPRPLGCFPGANRVRVGMPGRQCLADLTRTRANPACWSYPKIRLRRWDESRRDRTSPNGKTNRIRSMSAPAILARVDAPSHIPDANSAACSGKWNNRKR